MPGTKEGNKATRLTSYEEGERAATSWTQLFPTSWDIAEFIFMLAPAKDKKIKKTKQTNKNHSKD